MDGGGDYTQSVILKLHNYLHRDEWYKPYMETLEKKTGVKREYLLLGLGFAFIVNLILGFGGELCCLLVGIVYPVLQSVRVVDNKRHEESLKWLKYWIVFCCFNVFEFLLYFILSRIPLYWLLKCMFLVWCFIPVKVNGSVILFTILLSYLKPDPGTIPESERGFEGEEEEVPSTSERDLRSRKKINSAK